MPTDWPTEADKISPPVITIKAGIAVADFTSRIIQLLKEQWDATHTDSVQPIVGYSELQKEVQFREGEDYITVYTISRTDEPTTISYDFKSQTERFQLEFLTSGDREHMFRVVAEAERILQAARKDFMGSDSRLTGRIWAAWKGTTQATTTRLHYRITADFMVYWRFREVDV